MADLKNIILDAELIQDLLYEIKAFLVKNYPEMTKHKSKQMRLMEEHDQKLKVKMEQIK